MLAVEPVKASALKFLKTGFIALVFTLLPKLERSLDMDLP